MKTVLLVLTLGMTMAFAQPSSPPDSFGEPTPVADPEVVASQGIDWVLPTTKADFWQWGISFVTPLLIWGLGKIPTLPRPVLPTVTPLVGIGLGALLNWLSNSQLTWVDMTQAGAGAVMVRETINQWITKQWQPLEASKTMSKPIDNAVAVKSTTVAAKAELKEAGKPTSL